MSDPRVILAVPLPSPADPARRNAVIAAVLILLLATVGAGSASRLIHPSTSPPRTREASAPFDVDAMVERASHTIRPSGPAGRLVVDDPAYTTTFDARGFAYAPTDSDDPLAISLAAVERGGHALPLDTGAWHSDTDVATRRVGPAMRERVTARDGEVEWDLVLERPPAGAGDLAVRADLSGVEGATTTGDMLQLRLTGGGTVRMGPTVVLDANGHELARTLPGVHAGHVELHVPGSALVGAAYPVTVDPTVTSPVRVDAELAPHRADEPSVAFDGKDFLVVWTFSDTNSARQEIFATRVSGDGTSVGGSFPVSTSSAPDVYPDVAWNGSTFLVVWTSKVSGSDYDIYARRVSPLGYALGSEIHVEIPSGVQQAPVVAAGGSTFFVVWDDERTGAGDLVGKRVSGAGTVLDSTPKVVADDARREGFPDVAWNGEDFLVSYQLAFASSDDDVYTQLVTPSGARSGARQAIVATGSEEYAPQLASDGDGFLVAWERIIGANADVFARRTTAAGVPVAGNPIPVATANLPERHPVVAFNGVYLVGWARDPNDFLNHDTYAARIRTDGTVVDPGGFPVDTTPANTAALALDRTTGSERWTVVQGFGFDGDEIEMRIVSSSAPK